MWLCGNILNTIKLQKVRNKGAATLYCNSLFAFSSHNVSVSLFSSLFIRIRSSVFCQYLIYQDLFLSLRVVTKIDTIIRTTHTNKHIYIYTYWSRFT